MSRNAAIAPEPIPAPPRPDMSGQSRRERKKERTRSGIYRAAMDLFSERGFEGVTVEQICEAADVARGTFFAHFPTKSALLFEFNEAMAAAFEARLGEPRSSAAEELRGLVDQLVGAWLAHADVMGAMLREFLSSPPALSPASAAEAHARGLPRLLEDIVTRGQQRGEFRQGIAPRLAAAIFLSTSLAILTGGVFGEGEVSPGEARDQFLEALLHGLVDSASAAPCGTKPEQESA